VGEIITAVANPLDVVQQVRRNYDADAEFAPERADEPQDVFAAGRIEAVGRFVEKDHGGIVDERLGQLTRWRMPVE